MSERERVDSGIVRWKLRMREKKFLERGSVKLLAGLMDSDGLIGLVLSRDVFHYAFVYVLRRSS